MNALQSFHFHTHQLNVIIDDRGEPWFIAKHVAEILEYSDAFKMTSKLAEDEVQNRQIGGFGNRGVNLINESGLYSAILTSKKPAAQAFKKWVTSEVLPAIRKTGSYGLTDQQIDMIAQRVRQALLPALSAPVKRGFYTPEEDAVIREKRALGWGARRISRVLNRSLDSVAHRIRRLGV